MARKHFFHWVGCVLLTATMLAVGSGAQAAGKTKAASSSKASGKVIKARSARTAKAVRVKSAKRVLPPKISAAAAATTLDRDDDAAGVPGIRSASALVLDQNTGSVLYEKNAQDVQPIASITKVMTAMVVLDSVPDLNEEIVISREDVDRIKGSSSRLPVGARMTREEALLLALMSSENRAAHALGRYYPGGMDAFVAAMNAKAEALGMTNSRFAEPTGLSVDNVSTAHDLARMVAAAYTYPLIREWSTTPSAHVRIGRKRPVGFSNTNALVSSDAWEIGLSKTGYIQEAGKCLVMQAWVNGRPTVMVLLDSWGKLTRIGDANRIKRWMESDRALAALAKVSAS